MYNSNKTEMIESKVGSTLTEIKKGMKKVINGKTYNTETSKKVCGFDVNGWTHELYQTKNGEYFTYIFSESRLSGWTVWTERHREGHSLKREDITEEKLHLVSESEVRHMMERSGIESGDKKVTILNELKDWCGEENELLKVTGEGGLVNFDFGSWEVIVDIDDVNWIKMVSKGKTVFEEDDLDMIQWLRSNEWNKSSWEKIRDEYLKGRFGNRTME